jgi:hypothetical protein
MTNHRENFSEKRCKEHKVPICQIEEIIKAKQIEHLQNTGAYLSVPRAIIKLVLEGKH